MVYRRFVLDRYQNHGGIQLLGHRRQRPLGPTLKVAVWNICKAQYRHWIDDFERVCQQRDLVFIQEAVLNSPHDPIFQESNRYCWVMANSFTDRLTGISTGVKTGATSVPTAQDYLASVHAEPLSRTRKMVLLTYYALVNSQRLLCINAHALNFVSTVKYRQQLQQIDQAVQHHRGPLILAGDFNTWSGQRLRVFNQLAQTLGLTEAQLARKPRWRNLNRHLDHVYYRGLRLTHSQVLQHIQSSDHYPIQLTFSLLDSDRDTVNTPAS
jgi:endonuclease/exonuclease/phosphatase (EEP) superfamily protein YafD